MSHTSHQTSSESSLPPRALALFDFARGGGTIQGRVQLSAMPRLMALLSESREDLSPISWSLRGDQRERVGLRPQPMVHLHVRGELPLTCQRCLQGLLFGVDEAVDFRLVADEPALTQAELEAEDEALPATEPVNVLELIEDQLILALPIVPMHERCPQAEGSATAVAKEDDAGERQHPFAHLRDLIDRSGKA